MLFKAKDYMTRIRVTKIFGWLNRNKPGRCIRCGRVLNETEKEYYGNTCEKCEAWFLKQANKL